MSIMLKLIVCFTGTKCHKNANNTIQSHFPASCCYTRLFPAVIRLHINFTLTDSSFSCSSSFTILLTSLCENKNVCCHIRSELCSYSDTLFIEVLFPYFPFKHRIFVKRNHIKLLGKMIISLDHWWCREENCKRNCCQLWVAPGVREGLQGSSAWCDFRYEVPESLHIHL